ncbi:MAG TPA: PHP domain-containing protein, partial [Hyphomicrobium sp.]|nr:PHP domain-containing protein [Hyphomicrobium sp.]
MAEPTMPRYAELQVTTNFSFLRGASHAEDLVVQARVLGLTAIAVTDRNSLAGVVRAHVAAKGNEKEPGIRLVIGVRLDLEDAPSLLVYPTDRAAYGRLCRLLSEGQLRADKGKCTLYLEDVAKYAEGQIFIAVPPEDWDWREVQKPRSRSGQTRSAKILPFAFNRSHLLSSDSPSCSSREEKEDEESKQSVAPYSGPLSVGEERETLEVSLHRIKVAAGSAPLYLAASHTYRGDDCARIAALAMLGERCGTPIVATNDVLYHHFECRPLQDVVTCIREKTTLREAGLRLEANAERYIKSPGEMAQLFRGHEAALERTLDIVDACRFSLDDLQYEYPDEPVPPGKTPQEHLADLAWKGAEVHFPEGI